MTVYFVAWVAGALLGALVTNTIWIRAFDKFTAHIRDEVLR